MVDRPDEKILVSVEDVSPSQATVIQAELRLTRDNAVARANSNDPQVEGIFFRNIEIEEPSI